MDFNKNSAKPGIFINGYRGITKKTKYGVLQHQSIPKAFEKFREILLDIKDGIFVEIGVLGGNTLVELYDLCKKNNVKIIGIDPFENIAIYNGKTGEELSDKKIIKNTYEIQRKNRENLQNIIKDNKLDINLIIGTSWENHSKFEDNSIDLLHIDGDHSYEGVKKDINLYYPKVKKNGIIIFDDYNWKGVSTAVDEFIKNNNIQKENYYKYLNKFILKKNLINLLSSVYHQLGVQLNYLSHIYRNPLSIPRYIYNP